MSCRHDTRHKARQRMRRYGRCIACHEPIRTDREAAVILWDRIHWQCVAGRMGV